MDNKFTWGDPVFISERAPIQFHPSEFASICGFYQITSEEGAKAFECNIGDWIYTVELINGEISRISPKVINKKKYNQLDKQYNLKKKKKKKRLNQLFYKLKKK